MEGAIPPTEGEALPVLGAVKDSITSFDSYISHLIAPENKVDYTGFNLLLLSPKPGYDGAQGLRYDAQFISNGNAHGALTARPLGEEEREYGGISNGKDSGEPWEKVLKGRAELKNILEGFTQAGGEVNLKSQSLKPANRLLLHFQSAKHVALELQAKHGKVRAGSCNLGDPSRVYSRKAQYHWRWDWGPEMMTTGPWRPIYLRTFKAAIDFLKVLPAVSGDLLPSIKVEASLKGAVENLSILCTLKDADGRLIKQETTPSSDAGLSGPLDWSFREGEIDLWWPVGYGKQPLYTVEAQLLDQNGTVIDTCKKVIGFRRARLVQEPLIDEPGTSFLFEINNVRIFMQGSNWIPADTMLTIITRERYRAWLDILVEGNQNMLRMWSGGIYEPDFFYDICDELGILVWHDIIGFACGVYPAHESFVEQVRLEVEANVKNLSHHTSIVLWCGNNEDYQQVLQWGVTELPARLLYEKIFPEIVSRITGPGDSEVPYWPGSPYGGKEWFETADQTVGDIHEWHVWCAVSPGEYYQNYDILAGRFVSEFGLPSMPDIRTIRYWLDQDPSGAAKLPHPQSALMAQHCKAGSFERRFSTYMNENFRMTSDLETYAYLTQIMQSEGISYAYRSWRRNWKGRGREYTSGALVWQMNDSWPVTPWALVDYFLRKKPAFYTVARELRTFTIGILRLVEKDRENDRPRQFYEFGAFRNRSATYEVWCTNSSLQEHRFTLETHFYDLNTEKTFRITSQPVVLPPNQATETIDRTSVPVPLIEAQTQSGRTIGHHLHGRQHPTDEDRSSSVIIHCRLIDQTSGEVVYRTTNWPEPFKYLSFEGNPGLKIDVVKDLTAQGSLEIAINASKPIKGLFMTLLENEGGSDGKVFAEEWMKEAKWSDNALDVFPGDTQSITVRNVAGRRRIKVSRMGDEGGRVVELQHGRI